MKPSCTPERMKQLQNTRAYSRYRDYLKKVNPRSRREAESLITAAFNLVESYSGHHYAKSAGVASEACQLLVETFPKCIKEE